MGVSVRVIDGEGDTVGVTLGLALREASAYSIPLSELTYSVLSAPMLGPASIADEPVEYANSNAPVVPCKAYTIAFKHVTYTVPSAPNAGVLMILLPATNDHSYTPDTLITYSILSAEPMYTVSCACIHSC